MRRLFASAMLCLLLMLSVGVARCEAQCALAAMPMQPVAASTSAMVMHSSMEHCSGMQSPREGMPGADAACHMPLCRHQALPATSDSRFELNFSDLLQPILLKVIAPASVLPIYRSLDHSGRPPLLQRSPLDQSSSLRV